MVSNGSKAIHFAISMETEGSEPILGKKKNEKSKGQTLPKRI